MKNPFKHTVHKKGVAKLFFWRWGGGDEKRSGGKK